MVTKNYNIYFNGEELDYYKHKFIDQYGNNLKRLEEKSQIYDLNNTAVIISMLDKTEIKNKQTNKITFIGTKKLIDKTTKEIKSKGFSLEEIAN